MLKTVYMPVTALPYLMGRRVVSGSYISCHPDPLSSHAECPIPASNLCWLSDLSDLDLTLVELPPHAPASSGGCLHHEFSWSKWFLVEAHELRFIDIAKHVPIAVIGRIEHYKLPKFLSQELSDICNLGRGEPTCRRAIWGRDHIVRAGTRILCKAVGQVYARGSLLVPAASWKQDLQLPD